MTFSAIVTQYEAAIRLTLFFAVFGLMALWELLAPRRTLTVSKVMRWTHNLSLVLLNTIILRLLFPAQGFAQYFDGHDPDGKSALCRDHGFNL